MKLDVDIRHTDVYIRHMEATPMAKSYEAKIKAYKSTCTNMAGLEVLNMKFQIASENADSAGISAARAARWVFTAYPELREVAA